MKNWHLGKKISNYSLNLRFAHSWTEYFCGVNDQIFMLLSIELYVTLITKKNFHVSFVVFVTSIVKTKINIIYYFFVFSFIIILIKKVNEYKNQVI
jgi:hypothetical protein